MGKNKLFCRHFSGTHKDVHRCGKARAVKHERAAFAATFRSVHLVENGCGRLSSILDRRAKKTALVPLFLSPNTVN